MSQTIFKSLLEHAYPKENPTIFHPIKNTVCCCCSAVLPEALSKAVGRTWMWWRKATRQNFLQEETRRRHGYEPCHHPATDHRWVIPAYSLQSSLLYCSGDWRCCSRLEWSPLTVSPLCLRIAEGYTGGLPEPDTAAVELSTRLFIRSVGCEEGSGLDRGLSSISIISVLKSLIKGDSILTSFCNYLMGDDP